MAINWYPGHMHKATREIKDILPKMDVLIEVLDARIPYSSANPVIANISQQKPTIKLLNKSDLADPAITTLWLDHFNQRESTKAMAVTTLEPEKIRQIPKLIQKLAASKLDAAGNIHAMITGIPNVGKSTIINLLAGKAIAKTGNEPAVTKGQQRINLHNGIMLHDTPGILWPKISNPHSGYRLAATGAIKETAISNDDIACYLADFLLKHYPQLLKQRYQLEDLPDTEVALLEILGKKRGCLGGGGHVDFEKIAKILLTEFRDATIGAISLETPAMAEMEIAETAAMLEQQAAEKAAKKTARQEKAKKRRKT